jgi:hypothetical protein
LLFHFFISLSTVFILRSSWICLCIKVRSEWIGESWIESDGGFRCWNWRLSPIAKFRRSYRMGLFSIDSVDLHSKLKTSCFLTYLLNPFLLHPAVSTFCWEPAVQSCLQTTYWLPCFLITLKKRFLLSLCGPSPENPFRGIYQIISRVSFVSWFI